MKPVFLANLYHLDNSIIIEVNYMDPEKRGNGLLLPLENADFYIKSINVIELNDDGLYLPGTDVDRTNTALLTLDNETLLNNWIKNYSEAYRILNHKEPIIINLKDTRTIGRALMFTKSTEKIV